MLFWKLCGGNLRKCARILLEELRKITKHLVKFFRLETEIRNWDCPNTKHEFKPIHYDNLFVHLFHILPRTYNSISLLLRHLVLLPREQ
jgi:hypothetical protein